MGCFRLSDANKLKRENVCEAKLDQLNSTTFQPHGYHVFNLHQLATLEPGQKYDSFTI